MFSYIIIIYIEYLCIFSKLNGIFFRIIKTYFFKYSNLFLCFEIPTSSVFYLNFFFVKLIFHYTSGFFNTQ